MGESLAARLGRDPDRRYLVINGDDLGMCRAQNEAIFAGFASGLLSSATVMVPTPWAYDAARHAAAEGIGLGVHLTLTSEWDTYRWRSLTGDPRLGDAEGFLPRTVAEVYATGDEGLEAGRAECFAQVQQLIDWGVDVTHVDSHMGTNQLNADWFQIYVDVADAFDVPLRMGPYFLDEGQGFLQRNAAEARGLWFCDDLVLGGGDVDWWRSMLEVIRPGVTEIFIHPALDTPEIFSIASDDDASQRVDDWRFVTDAAYSPFAEFERITYQEIRAAQRAARAAGPPS